MNSDQRYKKLEVLGQGTYGKVFKALDQQSGRIVALKKLKQDEQDDQGISQTTLREISVLKKLKHPNIVELLDINVRSDCNKIQLIFEYVESDLNKWINSSESNVSDLEYKHIMSKILHGLAFSHQNGILHRDLKPSNILISREGDVKIADFGLAKAVDCSLIANNKTENIQSLWYRAPELLLGEKQYGREIDIWSLGCIFGEFMTKVPMFIGDSQIDQLFKIFQFAGTPTETSWPGVTNYEDFKLTFPKFKPKKFQLWENLERFDAQWADFVLKMLCLYPLQRISAMEALQHPFVKQQG